MRRLIGVMSVEGCMQAPVCECQGRESGSRISSRRERIGSNRVAGCNFFKHNLEISVDQEGKDAVVRVTGRVDVDSSPDLRNRLRTLLSEEALPQTIIVDLAG